jgi:TrmH family RNA methyltransferase
VTAAITSSSNEKVKYIRSLERRAARERERRFVVEGTRLIEEALRAQATPAFALYTEAFAGRPDGAALLGRLRDAGVLCESIEPRLLAALADTTTPPGILAVVPFAATPAPAHPTLILVADGVSTPGNLGTLLRSAEAAGADLVLLTPQTTDVFGPKVARGGMGAHFRLPLERDLDWPAIAERLRGQTVYVADAGGPLAYDAVDWRRPAALIVGSEAHGPSAEARALADASIYIPMRGATESLNAGVAGSVILFEAARQRRRGDATAP